MTLSKRCGVGQTNRYYQIYYLPAMRSIIRKMMNNELSCKSLSCLISFHRVCSSVISYSFFQCSTMKYFECSQGHRIDFLTDLSVPFRSVMPPLAFAKDDVHGILKKRKQLFSMFRVPLFRLFQCWDFPAYKKCCFVSMSKQMQNLGFQAENIT